MKNKDKKEILSITQIKIVLSGKTLELSSDEARQVYEELGKLFDLEDKYKLAEVKEEVLEEYKKLVPNTPPTYIPYPIYIEKWPTRPSTIDPYPWYPPWTTWCVSTAPNSTAPNGELTCKSEFHEKNNFYVGDLPGTCSALGQVGELPKMMLSIDLINQTT